MPPTATATTMMMVTAAPMSMSSTTTPRPGIPARIRRQCSDFGSKRHHQGAEHTARNQDHLQQQLLRRTPSAFSLLLDICCMLLGRPLLPQDLAKGALASLLCLALPEDKTTE